MAKLSEKLSPKQRKLADYVLRNYKSAAFLSSTALGAAAGVSESTVVRLALSLGYPGFPAFQAALQEIIQNELTTLDRFGIPTATQDRQICTSVFEAEVELMNRTLNNLSQEAFDRAVELLCTKKRVIVIGLAASSCLADYTGYNLSKVLRSVYTFSRWDENALTFSHETGNDTVAVVHAFPRYPRATISIAQDLKKKGVPIIGFTDSVLSPLAPIADPLFVIPLRFVTFVDHYAAVMALTHSIIVAVAYHDEPSTRERLAEFENFAKEHGIYVWSHGVPDLPKI